MADNGSSPTSGQTNDTRPAPGAMNSAMGRSSMDLATDQPAGFGPDPIAGADDRDTFSGTGTHPAGRDERIGGKGRKFNPDIPPDARLGLTPTVAGDAVPDHPTDAAEPADTRTRVASAALAGVAAAAILAAVLYVLAFTGVLVTPNFVVISQTWFGTRGGLDHVLGLFGSLIAGGLWGALFGLLVARPSFAKGMLFGLLPALFLWVVIAPLTGNALFFGFNPREIVLPVLYNVVIWGGLLGYLCDRWVSPPSTAAD